MFTYRTPKSGATSKQALARMNPIISNIRPLKKGKVYAPRAKYSQSYHRLDEILEEIAAILHPEIYPNYNNFSFFIELPETDPKSNTKEICDNG